MKKILLILATSAFLLLCGAVSYYLIVVVPSVESRRLEAARIQDEKGNKLQEEASKRECSIAEEQAEIEAKKNPDYFNPFSALSSDCK